MSQSRKDAFIINCPMCHSEKTIPKSALSDLKSQKIMKFRCTCGNHFHKQIIRKNFKKIDIISAIAQADIEVIWYKTKRLLSLFCADFNSERIQLV